MNYRKPAPDLPDRADRTGAQPFWRAVTTAVVTRAASAPMDTVGSGSELLPAGVVGLLTGLAPTSAAAVLFSKCARVEFGANHTVIIPRIVSSTTPIFIAEGAPHTIVQSVFDSLRFGPAC